MKVYLRALPVIFASAIFVTGCSTNPVTGKSEINVLSTDYEIDLGRQNYLPSRQAEGGDYVADPKVQAYVTRVGQRLAAVSDRELPYEFVVVNDSTPNAWALPGGKIGINRGLLLELQNEAQLAAVLAHEVVHAAARHGAQGMQRDLLLQGVIMIAGIALSGVPYLPAVLQGADMGSKLLQRKYGRDAEDEADAYGIEYMKRAGYDPGEAVKLQEIFVRLDERRAPGWLDGLFASHPPSQQRVENNRRTVAGLKDPGGEVGREPYQQALARLVRTAPAYAAYDEALQARGSGQLEPALRLVDKALRIEVQESLFHRLRSEILTELGEYDEAGRSVETAVTLNRYYYKNYMTRGLLRLERGDGEGARSDLERSVRMLPSLPAQYELGRMAMQQGRNEEAVGYFRAASRSTSAMGETASLHLAKLDLPANPGHYVDARISRDVDGFLRVVVENHSPVTITNVQVVMGPRRWYGMRDGDSYQLSGSLGPQQSGSVRTTFGPVGKKKARKYAARVIAASIVE